jgi:hypothetical protein
MTTKTLTGTYPSGYTITSATTFVSVTATGYVEESGILSLASGACVVVNDGRVKGDDVAVYLLNGADIINGSNSYSSALISGSNDGAIIRNGAGEVVNYGVIIGSTAGFGAGVELGAHGSVINGDPQDTAAVITGGAFGVELSGGVGVRVTNFGAITASAGGTTTGVYIGAGGSVINGNDLDATALIRAGAYGVLAKSNSFLTNYGTIANTYGTLAKAAAVYFRDGADISNGDSQDTRALIEGRIGVYVLNAVAVVNNSGTITGVDAAVLFGAGGAVGNGNLTDTAALIRGSTGVDLGPEVSGDPGRVGNYGTVIGTGFGGSFGVEIAGGGFVTNGAATDRGALIQGYDGVYLSAGGGVRNFGTIEGEGQTYKLAGVRIVDGGYVTNGSDEDRSALIEGYNGVLISAGTGTVANSGTILADDLLEPGVFLNAGGSLTNGSINNDSALIEGSSGVLLNGVGASANFGSIQGLGDANYFGAYLALGASLTNGASGHAGGLIEGPTGAEVAGTGTLTNFGAIDGTGGVAVALRASTATLVAEAGSVFEGSVTGDGGTLVLGSGVGTISGLTGGDVTVSGSMPTTTFDDFGDLTLLPAVQMTLEGTGTVSSGFALDDDGTLTVTRTLDASGTVSGSGTLALFDAAATFSAGTVLTVAEVNQSGAGSVATIEATTLDYAGVWTQSAGTVSVAAGDQIDFTGTGNVFSGTLTGDGTIAFTGGSDTLSGTTLSAPDHDVLVSGATVTLAGAINLEDTLNATTTDLIVAAGGATLSGAGGRLELTNAGTNTVIGASAAATLTNDDVIFGAGDLGHGRLTFDNGAKGIIEGDDSVALILDTGTNTIVSAGEIVAVTALTIDSPLDNAGVLYAVGGTLTALGAVTGAGHAEVEGGGTLIMKGAFNQNVTFASGSTGVIELEDAKGYTTGTITGFSTTGANALDLLDIPFVSGTTTATYTGTTTLGVLTVKEGANVAKITLEGDYLGSTFTVLAGPGGTTKVVDPAEVSTPHEAAPLSPHPFIAAMAGFAAPGAGASALDAALWRTPPPTLAMPRAQMA